MRKFYDFFAAEAALRRGNLAAVAQWVENTALTLDDIQLANWYFYELLIHFYVAWSRLAPADQMNIAQLHKSVTALAQLIDQADRHGSDAGRSCGFTSCWH